MNHGLPVVESRALAARGEALDPSLPGAPLDLRRARGARVWDVDGNELVDWQMAVGPLSLGYRNPHVDRAIVAQIGEGTTSSRTRALEAQVAGRLRGVLPGADDVRFGRTGADVTSAAVRIARRFTGRRKLLTCGELGLRHWPTAEAESRAGDCGSNTPVPGTFAYNDIESVEAALDEETACVVLEPIAFERPENAFLSRLRALCTERGALLVFDETWTGFRVALGGAQEAFDVRADLSCHSKAVANGMPLSALAGRRAVMQLVDDDALFSSTFGGEALSLAAAAATLDVLAAENVPAHMGRFGLAVQRGYNQLATRLGLGFTRCIGMPCRTMIAFDASAGDPVLQKSLVQRELLARGILWNGVHNTSLGHGEREVEQTLDAYRHALPLLARAVARGDLRGVPRS